MTIYNQTEQEAGSLSIVSVEEIATLSEIYNQEPACLNFEEEAPYRGRESLNKKIRIHTKGDITSLKVDAVINPVQPDLSKPPVGLCQQMFYKGGPMLRKACVDHVSCPAGKAFITEGFELPAQYVIHTAGPSPRSHLKDQERLDGLRQNYLSCLNVIQEQQFKSVAIPCLGTGRGGVSLQDGAKMAVITIRDWLETAEHSKLDCLVFCLVDNNQYEAVIKEMIRCFPRGTDGAGIDLEKLQEVSETILNPPDWTHGTPILCFRYNVNARNIISYHFHQLINHCHKELSPVGTEIDRYRNCAVFLLTPDKVYRCIIHHSSATNMIEVQILKFCRQNCEIDQSFKIQIDSVIQDFLETYLANVTPFEKIIRCEKSTWGSKYGLWCCKYLQLTVAMEIPCDHGNNLADTHMIRPKELLKQWPVFEAQTYIGTSLLGAESGSLTPSREPDEHSEYRSHENSNSFSSNSNTSSSRSFSDNTNIKAVAGSDSCNTKLASKTAETGTQLHHSGRSSGVITIQPNTYSFTNREMGSNRNNHCNLGDNFFTLTNSLKTDIVRPKQYNIIPSHQLNVKNTGTIENQRNNSLPSRIFSSFQSLFSSSSDKRIKSTEYQISEDMSQTGNETIDIGYTATQNNPAIRQPNENLEFPAQLEDDQQKVNSFTERHPRQSEKFLQSNNTIREETVTVVDNPINDLMAALQKGTGSFRKPSENPCEKRTHSSSSSNVCSSDDIRSNAKHKQLSDKDLLEIADVLGLKHEELGIRLGLKICTIEKCKGENPYNLNMQGFHILKAWYRKNSDASLDKLIHEMEQCDIDTYDIKEKFGRT